MDNLFENSRMFGYSVNKLIELVKVRPIIWDSSRPDFRSFNNKEIAWKEVYQELDDKYRLADEKKKSVIGMKITAKWRNIRDAFIRSHKKRTQHSKVKKYMHHDRLSFMLKLLTTDDTIPSPSRRISNNSESNVTKGSISLDDGSVGDPIMTVIKLEPEEEDCFYSARTVTEPKNYNYTFTSPPEPTKCNGLVPSQIKVEVEDEKPTYSDEESTSLKRKLTDEANECDKGTRLKVRKLEKEDQPAQREDKAEEPKPSESCPNAVKEVPNVSPDGDESFFASVLSFVRDMTEDDKLEFRMNVLQLIHGLRTRRRTMTASKELKAKN